MNSATDSPIHLTVCDTADEVRRLIAALQDAGFNNDEISVVCSQESCEREFAEFVDEHPAGSQTSTALDASAFAGLGLGTAAVLVGLLTTTGTAILAIGAFTGLAITGTFASMMMTRGAEKELADYYDQAISHSKILVAVETEDEARQQIADNILAAEGSQRPTALPKESVT